MEDGHCGDYLIQDEDTLIEGVSNQVLFVVVVSVTFLAGLLTLLCRYARLPRGPAPPPTAASAHVCFGPTGRRSRTSTPRTRSTSRLSGSNSKRTRFVFWWLYVPTEAPGVRGLCLLCPCVRPRTGSSSTRTCPVPSACSRRSCLSKPTAAICSAVRRAHGPNAASLYVRLDLPVPSLVHRLVYHSLLEVWNLAGGH